MTLSKSLDRLDKLIFERTQIATQRNIVSSARDQVEALQKNNANLKKQVRAMKRNHAEEMAALQKASQDTITALNEKLRKSETENERRALMLEEARERGHRPSLREQFKRAGI